uniref:Uncharacterized protein n=1 Tax=Candidatus Kentrum eta TaxID=2126337 RepID=A0A450UR26_9GAMM|nr:MAG: hypothetical protein BECKH772A_GA0070896_1000232 [Candidatus Kentron sp. H]VFJ88765.1 MAG: hypothetical protein BECKH772B_GA0070898_1000228 [Candidatus Kentron sp. H]VFJ95023.1 MAG: hypothetical protein BECKH772C_GA0070978_1000179 [Candidatus Kentron sp. H]
MRPNHGENVIRGVVVVNEGEAGDPGQEVYFCCSLIVFSYNEVVSFYQQVEFFYQEMVFFYLQVRFLASSLMEKIHLLTESIYLPMVRSYDVTGLWAVAAGGGFSWNPGSFFRPPVECSLSMPG